MKIFLERAAIAAIPVVREIRDSMNVSTLWRKSAVRTYQSLKSENLSLPELGTEHVY